MPQRRRRRRRARRPPGSRRAACYAGRPEVRHAAIAARGLPKAGGPYRDWERQELVEERRDFLVEQILSNDFTDGVCGYGPLRAYDRGAGRRGEAPMAGEDLALTLDWAVALVTGQAADRARMSYRGIGGWDHAWLLRADALAGFLREMAQLATYGHHLAAAALGLIRQADPYGARKDVMARVAGALGALIREGVDDVERRSGPEGGRYSDAQRPYSLRECLLLEYHAKRGIDPGWRPGWCMQALLDAQGLGHLPGMTR